MNKFAPGDRVVCIEASGTNGNLEEGATYTVHAHDGAYHVCLMEIGFDPFHSCRFKLAPEQDTPTPSIEADTLDKIFS